jgi:hypothetical protein
VNLLCAVYADNGSGLLAIYWTAIERIGTALLRDVGLIGHHAEWIEACKGGKAGGVNFYWAGPLAEAVLLGNVTLRLQLREDLTRFKLLWDSANLKFTNLEDANAFLRREYRAGWSL